MLSIQNRIVNALRQEPMTTREIARALDVTYDYVATQMRRLRERGRVRCIGESDNFRRGCKPALYRLVDRPRLPSQPASGVSP